jgi:hypothetical protein
VNGERTPDGGTSLVPRLDVSTVRTSTQGDNLVAVRGEDR